MSGWQWMLAVTSYSLFLVTGAALRCLRYAAERFLSLVHLGEHAIGSDGDKLYNVLHAGPFQDQPR